MPVWRSVEDQNMLDVLLQVINMFTARIYSCIASYTASKHEYTRVLRVIQPVMPVQHYRRCFNQIPGLSLTSPLSCFTITFETLTFVTVIYVYSTDICVRFPESKILSRFIFIFEIFFIQSHLFVNESIALC